MISPSDTWVLITGSSSGIGRELAIIYREKGYKLYLVARRMDRLQAIAGSNNKNIRLIAEDLNDPSSYQRIYQRVSDDGENIDILINNAGLGYTGRFEESTDLRNDQMLRVNINAVTLLNQLFLPEMIARRRGKILNVGSLGGFLPGPFTSTYYATKTYVFSYSQALAEELRNYGVQVSVLCPGTTKSEFWQLASGKIEIEAQSTQIVARRAYTAFHREKRIILTSGSHHLILLLNRLLPRKFTTTIVGKIMKKRMQLPDEKLYQNDNNAIKL